jgi:hypothetical protein
VNRGNASRPSTPILGFRYPRHLILHKLIEINISGCKVSLAELVDKHEVAVSEVESHL